MTEQDWADQAMKLAPVGIQSPARDHEEYRTVLLIWADWCEDEGLGYARGLRLITSMQDDLPRRPFRQGTHESDITWSFCPVSSNPYREILAALPLPVFHEMARRNKRAKDKAQHQFTSWLDAMKTLALAAQAVYTPEEAKR